MYKVDGTSEVNVSSEPSQASLPIAFGDPGTIREVVMHFSKSYAQILLSLPPKLRENAISYRQASPQSLSTLSVS